MKHAASLMAFAVGMLLAPIPARSADAASTLDRGAYLVTIGDCAGCHTTPDGIAFAGGRLIRTPFGIIPTPNITPDKETGLGNWTADDFYRSMHKGIGKAGEWLYPAFPYTAYTQLARPDVDAIFEYLKKLPPAHIAAAPLELRFPYRLRSTLAVWRPLYFSQGTYEIDAAHSPQWNRGAYLVKGVAHCNECHTSRDVMGGSSDETYLTGGIIPLQDWYAPDLSMQPRGGLAGWTQADLSLLLKSGTSRRGVALGPMAEVVQTSTQFLTDGDVAAISTYLSTLPDRAEQEGADHFIATAAILSRGKVVYAEQCATCHGKDGEGKEGRYPALSGNAIVLDPTGIDVTRAVFLGGFAPSTSANNEMPYSMPPFNQRLTDADVAAVVTYVRQAWGNQGTPVSETEVSLHRAVPDE